jgi:hypothetical protein
MKPYVEIRGEKLYLPQEVDAHRFEVCSKEVNGGMLYLLCPKVPTRYVQATGAILERNGNEMQLQWSGGRLAKSTITLEGMETLAIRIDWQAANPIITRGTDPADEE